jgi:hypothetical protein
MRLKTGFAALAVAIFIFGTATAPSASAAPPDDACSVLTQAQMSSALGVSVGAGTHVTPTFLKTCTWDAPSGSSKGVKYVTLMLETVDAYEAGKTVRVKTIVITSVSGVGDGAYYLAVGSNVGLIVKKGNVAFKVAVYGEAPLEQKRAMEKALALQALSKL